MPLAQQCSESGLWQLLSTLTSPHEKISEKVTHLTFNVSSCSLLLMHFFTFHIDWLSIYTNSVGDSPTCYCVFG